MSKSRPYPIDKTAPRFNIRKRRGHGQLIGCGWTEPWARRLAERLAELYGEPVVLLDCWKRKRIRDYEPSKAAVARAKAQAEALKARTTTSGFDGAMTSRLFFGVRRTGKRADEEVLPPPAPDQNVFLGDYVDPAVASGGSLEF